MCELAPPPPMLSRMSDGFGWGLNSNGPCSSSSFKFQPLITHQVNPPACHLGRSAFFKDLALEKKDDEIFKINRQRLLSFMLSGSGYLDTSFIHKVLV